MKKLAVASGAENWNLLQNNGRLAHQMVDHVCSFSIRLRRAIRAHTARARADRLQVHFHMIPKPNEKEGLGVGWPAQQTDMEKLKQLHEQLKAKI